MTKNLDFFLQPDRKFLNSVKKDKICRKTDFSQRRTMICRQYFLLINTSFCNISTLKISVLNTDFLYIAISITAVASGICIYFWRRKQKIFHGRYEDIINQIRIEEKKDFQSEQETENEETIIPEKNINIHDNTINTILQKLEKFEKSEKYLKKDNSLTSLASSLETNPRYLSEIIKQYKGKNFNNYLNGLRIQHMIQMLYKEPIYREYKITYLAEHCGFASREVFAIAFKKETGMTPSYFIEQLRDHV